MAFLLGIGGGAGGGMAVQGLRLLRAGVPGQQTKSPHAV